MANIFSSYKTIECSGFQMGLVVLKPVWNERHFMTFYNKDMVLEFFICHIYFRQSNAGLFLSVLCKKGMNKPL